MSVGYVNFPNFSQALEDPGYRYPGRSRQGCNLLVCESDANHGPAVDADCILVRQALKKLRDSSLGLE